MRASTVVSSLALVAPGFAFPSMMNGLSENNFATVEARQNWVARPWKAPGPNDARGPCPGMNTLANHGYLPSNGRDITLDILAEGMLEGYNIARTDAVLLFTQAVRTNPRPFARTFDLDTLGREGVLEHDYSLSRSDRYFANPLPFNETVWAETFSYFKDDMITVQQLADARMGRLRTSETTNPKHQNSLLADGFSWGECAAFFEIWADGTTATVRKDHIDYIFRNERLPIELGWTRRPTVMQSSERTKYSRMLMEAAGVSSGSFLDPFRRD